MERKKTSMRKKKMSSFEDKYLFLLVTELIRINTNTTATKIT
jgi:hypothetical protein